MRISFLGLLQCCTSIKIAELPKWVQIPPKVTKQGKSSQIETETFRFSTNKFLYDNRNHIFESEY